MRAHGELLRVLFAIDACDREVIAWSATTAGISGEMVRDLMIVCVERRFGTSKTPALAVPAMLTASAGRQATLPPVGGRSEQPSPMP
jgi:hypothetical protein